MKKRFWIGLAALAICLTAAFFMGGEPVKTQAVMRDITYKFGMDITVSGTVGSAIQEQSCTININGGAALVRPIAAGTDISDWFEGSETPLPAGLKVTVAEDAAVGVKKLKVKFSGTVYGASKDTIKMQVQNIFFDAEESDWYAYASVEFATTNAAPKFNIVRNFTKPSGYSSVGTSLYIKDQKSGTAGWKLSGAKGTAITSNNEMQVVIDGNFLVPMNAGYDVSYWFTGDLYNYNEMFSATQSSVLPDGVSVKLKNAVKIGDNAFTLVFSGTPSKGSMDLIAFTIPAGFVSYNPMSITPGDWQKGCKVTNITGKYCYDIDTDDASEKYYEYVLITYPEATLEAGVPVTEDDNLIMTMELVGSVGGAPITFTGVQLNHTTARGMCYQTNTGISATSYWNDHLYNATGLEAKIFYISDDHRTVQAKIYGTPKKQNSLTHYPFTLSGRGYTLNASYNSANHLIAGYTSGDTTLTITEPVVRATISKNVTIYKGKDDKNATITNGSFTIDLGDDELAIDIAKGTGLELFYPETTDKNHLYSNKNGIHIIADEAAKKGDHVIKAKISTWSSEMRCSEKGYLTLAFPKNYLKRTKDGDQDFYYIADSRIYVDMTVEHEPVKSIWPSDAVVGGKMPMEIIRELREHKYTTEVDGEIVERTEMIYYDTGIKLNPLGTGKVEFTLTLYHYTNIQNSYAAGDSVLDFVKLYFSKSEESPFSSDNPWVKQYLPKDYKPYDIRTSEAIEAGETEAPRVLHLYFDLSEMYPLQAYTDSIKFYVTTVENGKKCSRPSDTNKNFKFNIYNNSPSDSSGSNYDAGIVYNRQPVIVYAKDSTGADVETTYINLTEEKFSTELGMKCYSTDGGEKWKAATSINDKLLVSMLNKGMTLVIADNFDAKGKKPSDSATIYTFAEINARPKAPKLKVEYSTYKDDTGATAGQWVLADKELTPLSQAEIQLLDIAVAGSDGKKVSDKGYGSWPQTGGLNVPGLNGSKVATATFFIRTTPTADTPASKAVKIKVKGLQKAPKIKIDYKKEIIKGKENMSITCNGTALATNLTKDAAKTGIDISSYLKAGSRAEIRIWTGATAKKAATAVQTINAAARAEAVSTGAITLTAGKLKLGKNFEAYNEEKGKWGGLPKITDSCTILIRLKSTAKGGKESDTTFAASDAMKLVVTYGVTDAEKNKTGVISADVLIE